MSDSLLSLVLKSAGVHQNKIAVSYYNRGRWISHSYDEVMLNANIVASHLNSHLADSKCQFVGLHLDVTHTFPAITLGILLLNYAFVSLDVSSKSSCNNWLLHELGISIIVSNSECLNLEEEDLNIKANEAFNLFDEVVYIWKTGINPSTQSCEPPIAYAIQTSGSTGTPKTVKVPHSSIVPNIIDLSDLFGITSEDVIFFGSPATFDPSIVELFLAFANGAVLCIVEKIIKQDALQLIDIIFPLEGDGITFLQTTPSLFKRWPVNLINTRIFNSMTKFKILVLGGEPFPEDDLNLWNVPDRIKLFNIYGITEVSCWASVHLIENSKKPISIGKPLLHTLLSVRNIDSNGIGEMFIGSNKRICVINQEIYSELLNSKPIFRGTGDLFQVKGGDYYYIGRNDSIIKRLGIKINLLEIERTALLYENVLFAACVSNKEINILKVGLFIVTSKDFNLALFKRYLLQKLPKGSMPDIIETMEELPLTNHGKADHMKLKSFIKIDSSENPLLKFLSLWENYTVNTELMLSDRFMDLGGDSFTAIQLTSEFESCFKNTPKELLELLLKNSILKECCYAIMSAYEGVISFLKGNFSYSRYQTVISELQNETEVEKKVKRFKSDENHGYVLKCEDLKKNVGEISTPEFNCSTFVKIKCKGRTKWHELDGDRIDGIFKTVKLVLEERWTFFLGKCVDASPVGIYYKNGQKLVIIGSHSGRVVVINAINGTIISESNLPDRIESSACISNCGHFYFVGCYDGYMYKLKVKDSEVVWKFLTSDIIKCTAVVYKDFIIFGSYDKFLYCIQQNDGSVKWKTKLQGLILASPQVKDEIVYSPTLQGSLVALDTNRGLVLWEWISSPIFGDPIILEDNIVIAEVKGNLFWLNKTTGKEILSYTAEGMIYSTLATYKYKKETFILFGCQDGNIYCLRGTTLIWKSDLDSRVVASPFVFSMERKVLVVSVSIKGTVYILNFEDGSKLASYCLKNEVFSSPIVVNNNIVVGCRDDNVYFYK